MGREGEVQGDLVVTWGEMPRTPGHAFYDKLRNLLAEAGLSLRRDDLQALSRASDGSAVIAAGPLFPHAYGRVF